MNQPKKARTSPVGDFDYETHGQGYGVIRQTDPRIAAHVHRALGDARTVINVGAGTGSYEPEDRYVVAVEPSASMRAQRPPGRVPAIDARAEELPFDEGSFDASMAMVTVHQWGDIEAGLRELRRVSRGSVVVLTFDGDDLDRFWLADYVPELMDAERSRYPGLDRICEVLGGRTTVTTVPVPADCVDGFTEAFYLRPEAFLDPLVRKSQSAWGFVGPGVEERFVGDLSADLSSGDWDRKYGSLRGQAQYEGSLRLVTALR
jgi:hypothetical protein